jgi:splicing factor 3B subunit 2
MQEGAPPPWLINMQRYGPPPSYPNLRIPGLNAPLPPGATYGYHPGGWGKPPVDEYGRPLYGDVFGTIQTVDTTTYVEVDKQLRWGAFDADEDSKSDEDEEDEQALDEDLDQMTEVSKAGKNKETISGTETPYSIADSGWISGMETPDTLDLRKRMGIETPGASNQQFVQIFKENKATGIGGEIFASDHMYAFDDGKVKPNEPISQSIVQNESLSRHVGISSRTGIETEEDASRNRKRKAESSVITKRTKEFKF